MLKEDFEEGMEFQEFYSWSHMEGCLVLGKSALDSKQMASKMLCIGALGTYLG